ncbi:hypothetical protein FB382_000160 [Nocardioides ginsengisegetis]|uniref:Uncharacterized protein n=1 Tax=Nocardioides ginsengisegetis TaxID=661491 RepID=A0A7W3P7Y3_9ACTN|nr:hypothetical protein [Nocardioides ginsengisegetis]
MSTLPIESESGTFTGRPSHPHNGYWAGDFSDPTPAPVLTDWFAWGRARGRVADESHHPDRVVRTAAVTQTTYSPVTFSGPVWRP